MIATMEKTMNKVVTLLVAATIAFSTAAAQAAGINGEVKKIDEAAGRITLKHGPAQSLGMDEPMTMVYRVQDPTMLKQVKVGDKVSFDAKQELSGYTVTK